MSTTSRSSGERLFASLTTPEERVGFVEAGIDEMLAAQIRGMREARGWSQRELGERAGMAQATICALENPNYSRYSLRTLKRLAAAFDVGLNVRFTPFSALAAQAVTITHDDFTVPGYDAERAVRQAPGRARRDEPVDARRVATG